MEDLGRYTNEGLRSLLVRVVEEEKFESAALIRDELKNRSGAPEVSVLGMETQISILMKTTDFESLSEIIFLSPGSTYDPGAWGQNLLLPPTVEFIKGKAKELLEFAWNFFDHQVESYYEEVQYEGLTAFRLIRDGVKTLGLKYTLPYSSIDSELTYLSEEEYLSFIEDEDEVYMDFDDEDEYFDDEDDEFFGDDDEDDILGSVVFSFEGDFWEEKFDDEDEDDDEPISY